MTRDRDRWLPQEPRQPIEPDPRDPFDYRTLDAMAATGELIPQAVARLRRRMDAGEDCYPYYSIVRRPFVWDHKRRFTADEYNQLALLDGPNGLDGA